MAARKLPTLKSALGNRAGFASAFAEGLGVTESHRVPRLRASFAPCSTRSTE